MVDSVSLQNKSEVPFESIRLIQKLERLLLGPLSRCKMYKQRSKELKLCKETHKKKMVFIYRVLQRLPFLYLSSKEAEDSQWVKIAYELMLEGLLIPDIVRIQTGPSYFVSFGSIATQIKRAFYSLLLNNFSHPLVSGYDISLEQPRDKRSFNYDNINIRSKLPSDSCPFLYLSPEDMRTIILNGDRCFTNFYEQNFTEDDSSKEWYHGWGYVYNTEPDCYLAVVMEIGNCYLELEVLDLLLKLGLSYAEVPCTRNGCALYDLIKEKKSKIESIIIPKALHRREFLLEKLSKEKVNSDMYTKILSY